MTKKVAVIECDGDLLIDISTVVTFALAGKPIFYSDTMADLVDRHCPEVYEMADEAGYRFLPSNDKEELMVTPPEFWFDIIRKTAPN